MTNTELLEKYIAASGKKKKFLAAQCGLSPAGFRNCVTNVAEFKASQIDILCEQLGIVDLETKEAVFFAHNGA